MFWGNTWGGGRWSALMCRGPAATSGLQIRGGQGLVRLTLLGEAPTLDVLRGSCGSRVKCGGGSPHFFVLDDFLDCDVKDALEDVVVSELDAVGFDLVELRRGGTKSRPLIEVRIDRRDGVAVSVDDCAQASRALEARLDGSELVAPQYVLQVSSPGERPLRSSADWRRFVGQWANVLARSTAAGSKERSWRWRGTGSGQRSRCSS